MTDLIATAGAADANSYCTVAQADEHLVGYRLNSTAWDESTAKVAALLMATQHLDRLNWIGEKATSAQALRWPRIDAYDRDGSLIDSTTLPMGLVRATAEMAFWLIQEDRTAIPGGEQLAQLKAGPVDLKFRDRPGVGNLLEQLPDSVTGHLTGLTASSLQTGSGFRNVLRA